MKEQKELKVVELMIRLYCKKKHKSNRELCPECQELMEYVKFRRSKCPFGDAKPFCTNCKIHCYKSEMREKIREIMRFSGPRMIFRHPVIAIRHLAETKSQKRKLRKLENKKADNIRLENKNPDITRFEKKKAESKREELNKNV